jgi:hypothetical protein
VGEEVVTGVTRQEVVGLLVAEKDFAPAGTVVPGNAVQCQLGKLL